ncbi:MAG: hypothetical protein ACTSYF_00370 [Promethearchaeota archaeon]
MVKIQALQIISGRPNSYAVNTFNRYKMRSKYRCVDNISNPDTFAHRAWYITVI